MHLFLRSLAVMTVVSGIAPIVNAQVLVNLDFQSASSFTNNFRVVNGTGFAQQFDASGNGYIKGSNGTGTYIYDANGATAGVSSFAVSQSQPLTISFKPSSQSNGSIGVYIINSGTDTAYLALLNYNFSGSNDQLRFANAVVTGPSSSAAGTLVTGSHPNNTNFIANEPEGDAQTIPFASTASLIYSINALNEPQFSFTVNGTTSTFSLPGLTAFSNVEIGFRSNNGGTAMRLDDFSVSTVPEMGGSLLVALGIGCLLAVRRRI